MMFSGNTSSFHSAVDSFLALELFDANLDDRQTMLPPPRLELEPDPAAPEPPAIINQSAAAVNRKRPSIVNSILFQRQLEGLETAIVKDQPDGYPGHLTEKQLGICLKLRKWLQENREEYPTYHEI
eukprot:80973-Ditylum_brightwellii.AAC.1